MTEIEKMFENAGFIKKQCKDYSCIVCEQNNNCEKYPPFTAEKQLELIKWLSRNKKLFIRESSFSGNYYMEVTYNRGNGVDNPKFESCLASLINDIWQSLTDQEKEEIRRILE